MRFLIIGFLFALISACTSISLPNEFYSTEPTLASKTKIGETLKNLPAPAQKITLAVYNFHDYTGQHKPGDTPQYSRAVTQGGLSILKKALLDAGKQSWFRVLERGGLHNLLQERKIVRAMREGYRSSDGRKLSDLGPLLYSGLLLEGGIVAYESNITTGGAGARFLGIGAHRQYQRDLVTVYLSAVSVKNGEVLMAVNTTKTIYSTSTTGGGFYYVSFDKLAESEAGYTVNEPPQLAVRQAIEMAVYSLIMEGYDKKLWNFSDTRTGQASYRAYVERHYVKTGHNRRIERKPVVPTRATRPLKTDAIPISIMYKKRSGLDSSTQNYLLSDL